MIHLVDPGIGPGVEIAEAEPEHIDDPEGDADDRGIGSGTDLLDLLLIECVGLSFGSTAFFALAACTVRFLAAEDVASMEAFACLASIILLLRLFTGCVEKTGRCYSA